MTLIFALYSLTSVRETPFSVHQSQQEAQDSCNRIMQEDEIINEKISFFEKNLPFSPTKFIF